MAVAFEVRICHLFTEFFADALVFFGALAAAAAAVVILLKKKIITNS